MASRWCFWLVGSGGGAGKGGGEPVRASIRQPSTTLYTAAATPPYSLPLYVIICFMEKRCS